MPELEQQLQRLAAAVLDDVEPVTAGEVAGRAGRRSPNRLALVAIGVAAAVALVAAVLAVRDDTHTVDTVGPGGGRTVSWADLLALVPDTPESRPSLRITDLARYRELSGAEAGAGLSSLLGGDLYGNPPAEIRAELGFDASAVDQFVQWGRPPEGVTVTRGRVDRAAVARAVAADPLWSPLLEERSYEGVDFWSWGADYELNAVFSPLRGPGQSARLALVGDLVLWTYGDPELEASIDAAAGRASTLADDDDLRLAAEHADAAAMVTGDVWTRDELLQAQESCVPAPCTGPSVPEEHLPVVLLSGLTVEPGEVPDEPRDEAWRGVTVLVYEDEDAANAAVEPLQRFDAERRADMADDEPRPPAGTTSLEVVGRVVVAESSFLFPPL